MLQGTHTPGRLHEAWEAARRHARWPEARWHHIRRPQRQGHWLLRAGTLWLEPGLRPCTTALLIDGLDMLLWVWPHGLWNGTCSGLGGAYWEVHSQQYPARLVFLLQQQGYCSSSVLAWGYKGTHLLPHTMADDLNGKHDLVGLQTAHAIRLS